MKHPLCALALCASLALPAWGTAFAAPPQPVPSPLPAEVQTLLDKAQVPASALAVLVEPVSARPMPASGESQPASPPANRLSWQADAAMNPASVMKMVTTYAGLDLLGPAHFWRTRVYAQGPIEGGVLQGNLLIQGSGDPKLVHERLQELLQAVMDKGIFLIRGDIILDNGVFSLPAHNPAAFDDEPLRPYNAAPDGLLINFKSVIYKFIPDASGKRAHILTEPPISGVRIPASIATAKGACGNWRGKIQANFQNPTQVSFAGRYPVRCGEQSWAVAYIDPGSYASRVIDAMWRGLGGGLTGQVIARPNQPATGEPVATGYSLPLAAIIADINKFSNNVMAQQLFLTLSATDGHKGSFEASRGVLRRWWAGQSQLGALPAPIAENGAGLSRLARVSPRALVAMLQQAAHSPHAETYASSLSIAGIDGTMRDLTDPDLIGRAWLKTGTLRDVTAIAGYVSGRSGERYAIAAIINHPNAIAARPALRKLLAWVARD